MTTDLFTLGQAARSCNRSKATISRAVRSGRLPATRSNTGGWLIRPEDLERVFPVRPEADVTVDETPSPQNELRLDVEVERLRERLVGAEERLAEQAATIADLRNERDRLLAVIEAQARRRSLWWWRRGK